MRKEGRHLTFVGSIPLLEIQFWVLCCFFLQCSEFLTTIIFVSFFHLHGIVITFSLRRMSMGLCIPITIGCIALGLVSGVNRSFRTIFWKAAAFLRSNWILRELFCAEECSLALTYPYIRVWSVGRRYIGQEMDVLRFWWSVALLL